MTKCNFCWTNSSPFAAVVRADALQCFFWHASPHLYPAPYQAAAVGDIAVLDGTLALHEKMREPSGGSVLLPCVHVKTCNNNWMTLAGDDGFLVFVLIFSYEPMKPRHHQQHLGHRRRSSSSCRVWGLRVVVSIVVIVAIAGSYDGEIH